jgi:predicted nucleotidyltransferase
MSKVVFHRLDRDLIVRRLERYAREELARRPEVREAILIGSLARGDWSARSDADVVVVVDQAPERGPFRGAEYAPSERIGVAVDVLVYTPEETAAWSPRFRGEVERGILLYRREGGRRSPDHVAGP